MACGLGGGVGGAPCELGWATETLAEMGYARVPVCRKAQAVGISEADLLAWLRKVASAKRQEAP
jgi:hypothetical protein